MLQKKLFKYYDFTDCKIIAFRNVLLVVLCSLKMILHGACVYKLAKAVVDGKVPILGFISQHKHC